MQGGMATRAGVGAGTAHRCADAGKEVPAYRIGAAVVGAARIWPPWGAVADTLEQKAPHRRDAAKVEALRQQRLLPVGEAGQNGHHSTCKRCRRQGCQRCHSAAAVSGYEGRSRHDRGGAC